MPDEAVSYARRRRPVNHDDASAERVDASTLTDPESWVGGFYELAIELGERDDARLEEALRVVWSTPEVEGPWPRPGRAVAPEASRVEPGLAALEEAGGHLAGRARLPSGARVVCGTCVVREIDGPDWLVLYLPLGALGAIDPRVGGYPFSHVRRSLEWREPLDAWLRAIGESVFAEVPFELGAIGFEVSGEVYAAQLRAEVPRQHDEAYLLRVGAGLRYHPATH